MTELLPEFRDKILGITHLDVDGLNLNDKEKIGKTLTSYSIAFLVHVQNVDLERKEIKILTSIFDDKFL